MREAVFEPGTGSADEGSASGPRRRTSSADRTRRWRNRHPERRRIEREYSARYESTARGMVNKINRERRRIR